MLKIGTYTAKKQNSTGKADHTLDNHQVLTDF